MPDENKIHAMHTQGVKPQPCCATCKHFDSTRDRWWGACNLGVYKHEKHQRMAKLPVHATFTCPEFIRDQRYVANPAVREIGPYHKILTEQE